MKTDYSFIVEDLLNWYQINARTLPWRNHPDPYYIWVSEIMLQQTRVETVKNYFIRFTNALPTVKSLANAEPEFLLKLWEGLGYYNRVKNMQKAAITIMDKYNGQIPSDYNELLSLSGIGSYTAGAIASIAFKKPVPAVDGNVLRILNRITGSFDDISQPKIKKKMEQDLLLIMPAKRSGYFNQALMDLGASICIPNGSPLCNQCPLSHHCVAYKKNLTPQIPVKKPKKSRKKEQKTIILFQCNNEFALNQRSDKGLLPSLWEYPNIDSKLTVAKFEKLLETISIYDYTLELLGESKHIFSHIEWHMIGYRVIISEKAKNNLDQYVWCNKEEILKNYAIPTAFSTYTKQL